MDAYIGIGTNLGDRQATLARALDGLRGLGAVRAISRLYETAPVLPPGSAAQPEYWNGAVLLDTPLSPQDLLRGLLAIEAAAGRVRSPTERYLPRTLDLDVLLLGPRGEEVVQAPDLEVPHPRLHQRLFALRPLLDIGPDLRHPVLGRPLAELYAELAQAGPLPRPLTGETGWGHPF